MKIMIDPGHGGSDSGATCYGKLEKNCNMEVAVQLKRFLEEYKDVEILMTRWQDTGYDLASRTSYANREKVDLYLSMHLNAGGGAGVEVYYSKYADQPFVNYCRDIMNSISAYTGVSKRGCKTRIGDDGSDYYHVIRETTMPAIIVESLFIDNSYDMSKYDAVKIAEAVAAATARAYGLQRKDPVVIPPVTTLEKYVVIAGTYNTRENAQKKVADLAKIGIDAYVYKKSDI